jgi:hypothetical protein
MDMVNAACQWTGIIAVAGVVFLAAWLGTVSQSYIDEFRTAIWNRYQGDGNLENADRALAYLYQNVDREINKVLGILTFDSILLVVAQLYTNQQEAATYLTLLSRVALSYLLISILVSLYLFFPKWGGVGDYKDVKTEFMSSWNEVRKRSMLLTFSATLSLISALAVSTLMIMHV